MSVRDPTLQTSTSEKLERRYPLREHKPPHTFSWSYLNYENCSRHLHALLLVHDVIVVLGFFFCLPLFQGGKSRTLRMRGSFDVYHMLRRTYLLCLFRFNVLIRLRKYLKPQYIIERLRHGFISKIYHHGSSFTFCFDQEGMNYMTTQ